MQDSHEEIAAKLNFYTPYQGFAKPKTLSIKKSKKRRAYTQRQRSTKMQCTSLVPWSKDNLTFFFLPFW
jgi:hypothetical protein